MTKYNVDPVQTTPGWSTTFDWPENLDTKSSGATDITKGTAVTFTYDKDAGKVLMSINK